MFYQPRKDTYFIK